MYVFVCYFFSFPYIEAQQGRREGEGKEPNRSLQNTDARKSNSILILVCACMVSNEFPFLFRIVNHMREEDGDGKGSRQKLK